MGNDMFSLKTLLLLPRVWQTILKTTASNGLSTLLEVTGKTEHCPECLKRGNIVHSRRSIQRMPCCELIF